MTQKDFRKLNRAELLEILLAQAEEIDRLHEECRELQKKLDERKIMSDRAGSIAEASLKIHEVFEAAQAAADEYLENVASRGEEHGEIMRKARMLLIETERRCAKMEQETMAKCDAMMQEARKGRSSRRVVSRPEDFIW